jgi:hypothetical protein
LTLIDLLLGLLILAAALVGSFSLGTTLGLAGYLLGPFVGVSVLYLAYRVVVYLEEQYALGRPRMPPCRTGTCPPGGFKLVFEDGYILYKCACGRRYRRERRPPFGPSEVFEITQEGDAKSYMRWKPFRGWTAEGPFTQQPHRVDNDAN